MTMQETLMIVKPDKLDKGSVGPWAMGHKMTCGQIMTTKFIYSRKTLKMHMCLSLTPPPPFRLPGYYSANMPQPLETETREVSGE